MMTSKDDKPASSRAPTKASSGINNKCTKNSRQILTDSPARLFHLLFARVNHGAPIKKTPSHFNLLILPPPLSKKRTD